MMVSFSFCAFCTGCRRRSGSHVLIGVCRSGPIDGKRGVAVPPRGFGIRLFPNEASGKGPYYRSFLRWVAIPFI
ncbi:MAG: hypothetical protein CVV46_14280 [Spirochaetae bacterium HGW-Spirochaetae-2]|nr:MAG: hypothetical protein CVV46_14280 [Spirochaetae bacterium HGW-Spirochaetae-2]